MCELLKNTEVYYLPKADDIYIDHTEQAWDQGFEFSGDNYYPDGRIYKSGGMSFNTSTEGTVKSLRQLGIVKLRNGGRIWCVDKCLVPILEYLNFAGYETASSCCGHGIDPDEALDIGFWMIITRTNVECVEKIIRAFHPELSNYNLHLRVIERSLSKDRISKDRNRLKWLTNVWFKKSISIHTFIKLVPGTLCSYNSDDDMYFDNVDKLAEYLTAWKELAHERY